MSQKISSSSTSAAPAPSAEKKALIDAFDSVLKTQADERHREAEERRRAGAGSSPLVSVATLILLAVGAYLAVMRPTWVFAPRPTPETVALREASLRVSMANAAQHVERFRKRSARLPASLEEAGTRDHGLRYDRLGATDFRLVGENGPARVRFTSGEPLADFLGNSYQIIARRTR